MCREMGEIWTRGKTRRGGRRRCRPGLTSSGAKRSLQFTAHSLTHSLNATVHRSRALAADRAPRLTCPTPPKSLSCPIPSLAVPIARPLSRSCLLPCAAAACSSSAACSASAVLLPPFPRCFPLHPRSLPYVYHTVTCRHTWPTLSNRPLPPKSLTRTDSPYAPRRKYLNHHALAPHSHPTLDSYATCHRRNSKPGAFALRPEYDLHCRGRRPLWCYRPHALDYAYRTHGGSCIPLRSQI